MARKRLSAPFGDDPALHEAMAPSSDRAPETKAMPFGRPSPSPAAPIARVAGDAATAAALEDLAREMTEMRREGRLAEALPLASVVAGHFIRDRAALDEGEMAALVESLRAHGQRMPVEVVELSRGHYGLISGWRRLTALTRLHEETNDPRFARVLAVLRRPATAGAAYVAMVEENEIRAGLSYYERARIAVRAAEAGAFPDRGEALRALYATASRAKRSKIGSFMTLVDALDAVLRFPAAIPERLGLALSARLDDSDAGQDLARRLATDLATHPAPAATAEMARLSAAIRRPAAPPKGEEIAPGLHLSSRKGAISLTGPGVDAALRARLAAWLREPHGT